jgi:hypothetical protein
VRGDDPQQAAILSSLSRGTRAPGAPLAGDSGDGRCGAQRAVATIGPTLLVCRLPVDCPEKLLRALLLPDLYTVHSERLLMEQVGGETAGEAGSHPVDDKLIPSAIEKRMNFQIVFLSAGESLAF